MKIIQFRKCDNRNISPGSSTDIINASHRSYNLLKFGGYKLIRRRYSMYALQTSTGGVSGILMADGIVF